MSEDEKALLYNLRSLARMEHADLSIGDEAADAIERIARERDEARAEIERLREVLAEYAGECDGTCCRPQDRYSQRCGFRALAAAPAEGSRAMTAPRAEKEAANG
jgi:hypothetical protein